MLTDEERQLWDSWLANLASHDPKRHERALAGWTARDLSEVRIAIRRSILRHQRKETDDGTSTNQ